MKKNKRIFGKIIMVLALVFFYLPIIFVIIFSFNSSKSLTAFKGFSLKWYEKIFASSNIMGALSTTVLVAVVATFVSTLVGTLAAVGLSRSRKVVRDLVLYINDFPIMNPEIVTAIGLMLLFISVGIDQGLGTMMLAHIGFCTPYVILSVMPKLRSLDPNLADAAMDLGATPWQALTMVIVPEIAPGIFSGALIAFTMSFDDFVISYFVTGSGVKNLSILIYTMSKRVNPTINALSALIVAVITVGLLVINIVPIAAERSKAKRSGAVTADGTDAAAGAGSGSRSSGRSGTGNNRDSSRAPEGGRWKRYAAVGAAAVCLAAGALVISRGGGTGYEGQTLRIYMPSEYLGENTISSFEAMTGAQVVINEFESNEQMYIKVANGDSYDILIPSDYMIERLVQEDMLQPLDKERLTCFDDLLDECLDLEYDPGNEYSVPYLWGTVGICYDTTVVDYEDLENDGFAIFANPKYKGDIYLYDSEREEFMMGLKHYGYSMNSDNPAELEEAYEFLLNIVGTMDAEIVTDEIIDNLAQGRKALGLIYSGDATYVISENEDMDFYMPEYGTNIFVDGMVIPRDASNVDLAYEFMNYIDTYDAAYDTSSYVGYTSPNAEVYDELSGEGGDYEGISSYTPRGDNPNDEVFHYDAETRKIMGEYWGKVKIAASNAG